MKYIRKYESSNPIDISGFGVVNTETRFKQYDNNTSILVINLLDNGEPVNIENEIIYVSVKSASKLVTNIYNKYSSFQKETPKGILLKAKVALNNKIEIPLSPLVLQESGNMIGEILIVDMITSQRITSQQFTFDIEASLTPNQDTKLKEVKIQDIDGYFITDSDDMILLAPSLIENSFRINYTGTELNRLLDKIDKFNIDKNIKDIDKKFDRVSIEGNNLKFFSNDIEKQSVTLPTISGEDGATFTPNINSEGLLSWENNKGLENPEPINIKGTPGRDGQDGLDGVTPNITIGEVTTLEAGQQATVTKRGTVEEPIFDFGIPKGQDGVGDNESSDGSNVYIHNSNKVINIESYDWETGIFTTRENLTELGVEGGSQLIVVPHGNFNTLPNELTGFNFQVSLSKLSDNTFKNGARDKFNQSNKDNVDFSTFHFEVVSLIELTDINSNNYSIDVYGLTSRGDMYIKPHNGEPTKLIGHTFCNSQGVPMSYKANHPTIRFFTLKANIIKINKIVTITWTLYDMNDSGDNKIINGIQSSLDKDDLPLNKIQLNGDFYLSNGSAIVITRRD